jgi:polar amino acid transport system substrate-binding protein
MIKKFKFIGSLLLASTILFTAAGCSKTKETSTDTKNTSRKIVVGMDDTFPPMEYRDEANNLKGFDIDLANELGKKLNIQFEFMPTDWNGVIQSLKSKRFDIILSALSITPEREQEIAFSRPYMAGGQIIVVKKDNTTINTREDLKGKVVGLQLGSTAEAAVKDIEGSIKQVKKYDKNTGLYVKQGDKILYKMIDDESKMGIKLYLKGCVFGFNDGYNCLLLKNNNAINGETRFKGWIINMIKRYRNE